MFSLGCILYNMIYKRECHPYLGYIEDYFQGVKQEHMTQVFCLGVNQAQDIIELNTRQISKEILNLIRQLCEKDIEKRMTFSELILSEVPYLHLRQVGNENLENMGNLFDLNNIDQEMSILRFQKRRSQFVSLYPQPQIEDSFLRQFENANIGESKIESAIKNQNQYKQASKVDFAEDREENIEDSIKQGIELYNEQQLDLKLQEMEEEINRLDEFKQRIFVIFDACFYYREIIFFFDKLSLHIDILIKLIKNNAAKKGKKDKQMTIIDNLQSLKGACVNESIERNISIYKSLKEDYNESDVLMFKVSDEFERFEKIRKQDEKTLDSYIDSITYYKEKLSEDLFHKCMSDFVKVYKKVEEQQQKQVLVVYWYIYQARSMRTKTSFCDKIEYKQNSNKFLQYYESIDHRLDKNTLFQKVLDAWKFHNISVIFNF